MRRPYVITAAAIVLGGCHGSQNALDFASDQSRAIGDIWHLMLVVCGLMYALMMGLLAWAMWRTLRRSAAPRKGHSPQGDRTFRRLLASWCVLIVVGLFVLAGGSFLVDRSLARSDDPNALQIRITGSEWWWQVEYLDGDPSRTLTTANELHLPLGHAARIELRSNDVIHSFWVPNLQGKTDLIPGRSNFLTITPRRTGRLRGQCAEFCGLEHARMALDVYVDDPTAFAQWRAQQLATATPPGNDVQHEGQHVFLTSTCAACHAIAGTEASGRVGPDLTHLASRRSLAAGALPMTPTALRAWIRQPQAAKPGTNMPASDLSDAQLDALVDYLGALK